MSSMINELSRTYGMGGASSDRDLDAIAAELGVGAEELPPASGSEQATPLGELPMPGSATPVGSSSSRWASRPVPWTPQTIASIQSGVDRYEPNPMQIQVPRVLDYADAVEYIDVIRRTDPDTYNKILAAMRLGDEPYLSGKSMSRSAVRAAWTEVVKDSALLMEQGQEVTPLQLLGQKVNGTWIKPVRQAAKAFAEGETEGPQTRTATSENESVTLTSRSEAERILDSALAQYLGRQATAAEVRRFKRSLNAAEEEKPVVSSSETTQTTDTQGNTQSRSSSKQSGGQDPMEAAEDFAKQQEGYGEYQASTTYLDAFRQTLQGDTL